VNIRENVFSFGGGGYEGVVSHLKGEKKQNEYFRKATQRKYKCGEGYMLSKKGAYLSTTL
jgi:hypothetical protein